MAELHPKTTFSHEALLLEFLFASKRSWMRFVFFLRLNELGGRGSFKRTSVPRVRFFVLRFSVPNGERERTFEVRFVFLSPFGTA